MWAGAGGAAIGSIANIGMGLYNAHKSAKEARAADARQYSYSIQLAKEIPKAQRIGLEAAGYNPMLALGDIGGASAMASHQGISNLSLDGSSAKALGEFAENLSKDKAKAEVDNIKADTDLKKGQLEAAEAQRLQTEANTSLLQSQAERSDLAYGRDIVDTVTGIAGTGASLYSAKAMADVAKANAAVNARNADVNARNATVNERRLDSHTSETRYDKKGKPVGRIERSSFSHGVPTVDSSAKGSKPNAAPHVGFSAKSAGAIAKEVATAIVLGLPYGVLGAGVGAGMKHVREREAKEYLKKSKDKSRHWYHNFDRFHFDY